MTSVDRYKTRRRDSRVETPVIKTQVKGFVVDWSFTGTGRTLTLVREYTS